MINLPKHYTFLFFLAVFLAVTIVHPQISFALDCGVAKISPDSSGQNWNLSYCFSSPDKNEVLSVSSVKVTCRSSPSQDVLGQSIAITNLSCHESWQDPLFIGNEAVSQSQSIAAGKIGQNSDGSYFSCFTIQSLNRNMGNIEITTSDTKGDPLCNERTDVTPGNYTWAEYFDETLESRFGIDLTTREGEDNSLFCANQDLYGKDLAKSIATGLGCLPIDPAALTDKIIKISIGLGGGIALLLILYGTFIITTSSGIPDKLNAGKDIITSAISGLIVVILSVVILNIIGIKTLALPGLQ